MSVALDSSVLVAALDVHARHHDEACNLLHSKEGSVFTHALSETVSTLTGSRLGYRVLPADASILIREDIVPYLQKVLELSPTEILKAFDEAESRGVRGGANYDFLHLAAAANARIPKFFTLNTSHFRAFYQPGDPEIFHP